jgi:hypothetical protein
LQVATTVIPILLIQAGSGAVTFGSPNSPGVTAGTKDTLLATTMI